MVALSCDSQSLQEERKQEGQGPWVVEIELRRYCCDEICGHRRKEALLRQLQLQLRLEERAVSKSRSRRQGLTIPMAMPAIAPVERPWLWLSAAAEVELEPADEPVVELPVGAEEDVDVVKGVSASFGQSSPGRSIKDELAAYSFCTSKETLALGLITPTICQSIHEPGAPQ